MRLSCSHLAVMADSKNMTEQLDTGVSLDFSFQFVKEKEKSRVFFQNLYNTLSGYHKSLLKL